jgi:hypothetical protein
MRTYIVVRFVPFACCHAFFRVLSAIARSSVALFVALIFAFVRRSRALRRPASLPCFAFIDLSDRLCNVDSHRAQHS